MIKEIIFAALCLGSYKSYVNPPQVIDYTNKQIVLDTILASAATAYLTEETLNNL